MSTTASTTVIPADQALTVAQTDAARVYRDLSEYAVRIVLEEDGWHIDYEPKVATHKGGGPHYVIDAGSAEIRSKRYDQ